jgi:hypothetical protein
VEDFPGLERKPAGAGLLSVFRPGIVQITSRTRCSDLIGLGLRRRSEHLLNRGVDRDARRGELTHNFDEHVPRRIVKIGLECAGVLVGFLVERDVFLNLRRRFNLKSSVRDGRRARSQRRR